MGSTKMFVRSIILLLAFAQCLGEDYYELLGLQRNADQKAIRQAFKKLAVMHHPDKNSDNPEAHMKFIKYTTAYEVLKDPDLRRKYDLYGEDGLNDQKKTQNYHSWSYYQNNFGIYDDDPQVVTLNKNDFHDNVINSEKLWMINFYSPMCSHCHTVAPVWRRIAKDFEGVIRIGAVNCEDDWSLCRQLSIQAYPTILFYSKNSHQGTVYSRKKTYDEISDFIISKIDIEIDRLKKSVFLKRLKNSNPPKKPLVIFTCGNDRHCFENNDHLKIAAIFENILHINIFNCDDSCNELLEPSTSAVFIPGTSHPIKMPVFLNNFATVDDLVHEILQQLPEPDDIYPEKFDRIRRNVETGWLICFYIGHATELDLQLKRLPGLISGVNLGKINCGKHPKLCSNYSINRYPMWGVLKPGGAFELSHGKDSINEIAKFAKNSIKARNVFALSSNKILSILQRRSKEVWFLDWYAPWCPPCLLFLPELRRASMEFDDGAVNFGTIDCAVHSDICRQYNIRSYPTAMLINGSSTFQFTQEKTSKNVVEFINESINPTVVRLNSLNFHENLGRKSAEILWVVDYFAPWCGPCQQLAPEWTKVAKVLHKLEIIRIATVDCEAYSDLCRSQDIKSYPAIRLYPIGSEGLRQVAIYSGSRDANSLMRWIVQFLPIKVKEFYDNFDEIIFNKKKKEVWVIDYFAPWCGHCHVLEPHFALAAQMVAPRIKFGRVNCDNERDICSRAGVRAYPTVVLYNFRDKRLNGGRRILATTAEAIRDEILGHLQAMKEHDEL